MSDWAIIKWCVTKAYSWLPVLSRLYFTEARLNRFIDIDVRPRDALLNFNVGTPSRVETRLRIINFSVLPLTVEQIKVEIWGLGNTVEIALTDHVMVKPSSFEECYVKGLQGTDMRPCLESGVNQFRLNISARIATRVRTFEFKKCDLQSAHIGTANCPTDLRMKILQAQ